LLPLIIFKHFYHSYLISSNTCFHKHWQWSNGTHIDSLNQNLFYQSILENQESNFKKRGIRLFSFCFFFLLLFCHSLKWAFPSIKLQKNLDPLVPKNNFRVGVSSNKSLYLDGGERSRIGLRPGVIEGKNWFKIVKGWDIKLPKQKSVITYMKSPLLGFFCLRSQSPSL